MLKRVNKHIQIKIFKGSANSKGFSKDSIVGGCDVNSVTCGVMSNERADQLAGDTQAFDLLIFFLCPG
jgi:hypothetical protein